MAEPLMRVVLAGQELVLDRTWQNSGHLLLAGPHGGQNRIAVLGAAELLAVSVLLDACASEPAGTTTTTKISAHWSARLTRVHGGLSLAFERSNRTRPPTKVAVLDSDVARLRDALQQAAGVMARRA